MKYLAHLSLVLTLALGAACLLSASAAPAAAIIVTTTDDELDSDGDCSLREAIQAANTHGVVDACTPGSGDDTITLPTGVYTLTLSGADEDVNTTGDLDIAGNLTLSGAGADVAMINGGGLDRVLHILSGTVTIQGVTITGGKTPDGAAGGGNGGDGGGIYIAANATLTLTHSAVSSNATGKGGNNISGKCGHGGWGGGLYNLGALTLDRSTVSNNRAGDGGNDCGDLDEDGGPGGHGGGLYNAGILVLDHGHIGSNSAGAGGGQYNACGDGGWGGGIYNTGTLTVTDSTVSGNRAGQGAGLYPRWCDGSNGGSGGGIYNIGTLVVSSSTLASNAAGNAGISWASGGHGGDGGSIYNASTVTLTLVTIAGNTAGLGGGGPAGYGGPGGNGGGIYNGHVLVAASSTFSGNSAGRGGGGDYAYFSNGGDGGGIYNVDSLRVARCTLSDNAAGDGGHSGWGYPGPAGTGGGIYSSGVLTVTDSTISSNKAGNGGGSVNHNYPGAPGGSCGGLDSAGPLSLTNSTISDNQPGYGGQYGSGSLPGPDGDGGGLCAGGTAGIRNTIIGNSALPSIHDCLGSVHSDGYNLVEVPGACLFTATGDLLNVGPQLGPLANNGGDTFTHALLPGSPAVDYGLCNGAAIDQRGLPRPIDIPDIVNAPGGDGCDIGAYEAQPVDLLLTKTVNQVTALPGQRITYTIVAQNIGVLTATATVISDVLPAGLAFAGPITLDPPNAGIVGMPPTLVSSLTLAAWQSITVTLPLTVNVSLSPGVIITNWVSMSSSVGAPVVASATITIERRRFYLPLFFQSAP